jgi:hypothetical protein
MITSLLAYLQAALSDPGKRLQDTVAFDTMMNSLFAVQTVEGAPTPTVVLTGAINQVTSGPMVVLQPALAGRQMWVINSAPLTLTIMPSPINPYNDNKVDNIDGLPAEGQLINTSALYICATTGTWTRPIYVTIPLTAPLG